MKAARGGRDERGVGKIMESEKVSMHVRIFRISNAEKSDALNLPYVNSYVKNIVLNVY